MLEKKIGKKILVLYEILAPSVKSETGTRKKPEFGQPRFKNKKDLEEKFQKEIENPDKIETSSVIPLSDKKIDPEIEQKMPYLTNAFGWLPNIVKSIKNKYKKEVPKQEVSKKEETNDTPPPDGFENVPLNTLTDKSPTNEATPPTSDKSAP